MSAEGTILNMVRNGLPLEHIPVIDFHCHLGTSSFAYYVPYGETAQIIDYMKLFGVDHLVTFSFNIDSDPLESNRFQYSMANSHPDEISALTYLHARHPQDWISLLEEGKGRGSKGIKLISAYQQANENNTDWTEALAFANENHWLVLNHHWGSPEKLEKYAKEFSETVFMIGHSYNTYAELIKKYDNVYQNTCAAFCHAFTPIEELVEKMPVEKIIHGSDALDLDFGTSIGPIAYADIPEKDKEMILGGNALRLMNELNWDKSFLS